MCLLFRCLEGSGCPYHHDWYSDRPAVVHLWLRQGLLPPAPPPSPWDARVPEEEARPHRVKPPPPPPLSRSRHIWTPQTSTAVFYIYVLSSCCSAQSRGMLLMYIKQKKHARREDGAVMESDRKYSSVETPVWFYQFLSLENCWNSNERIKFPEKHWLSVYFLFNLYSFYINWHLITSVLYKHWMNYSGNATLFCT